MSYTAPNRLLLPARHSIDTITDSWQPSLVAASAAAWPAANQAIYVPLRIPSRVTVVALWVATAATGAGNIDMALYDAGGTAVVAATNAAHQATLNEQVFDVTDTTVGPGLYYIGCASDTGTGAQFYRWNPAQPICTAYGVLMQSSAYPLPTTATMAVSQSLEYCPIMGVLLEATVT